MSDMCLECMLLPVYDDAGIARLHLHIYIQKLFTENTLNGIIQACFPRCCDVFISELLQ